LSQISSGPKGLLRRKVPPSAAFFQDVEFFKEAVYVAGEEVGFVY